MMRLFSLAAVAALAACAGRPPEVPTQASQEPPAEREAASADGPASTSPSSSSSSSSDGHPPGDLVCRAVSNVGSATELFLEWNGNEARGVLRETAPSGMVHDQRVRAQRHQGLVIADDIHTTDLVDHAAVVADRNGKKAIKVGDSWSSCQ